jgi:hypothetical protein
LRAKRKREEMTTVLRKMRATGGADKKKWELLLTKFWWRWGFAGSGS